MAKVVAGWVFRETHFINEDSSFAIVVICSERLLWCPLFATAVLNGRLVAPLD